MKLYRDEYKEVIQLPKSYRNEKVPEGVVVLAVRKSIARIESDISLRELLRYFVDEGLVKSETAQEIVGLYNLRNSFHFRKVGDRACTVHDVERALALLVYTLQHAPAAAR